MAEEVEVVSAVGTWVAAFLALLALGVFVGPFFIWRASQTERHQALDKLEKGEAGNAGFISKGIRVTPTIRLFRRIRVPELGKEPQFPETNLVWSDKAHVLPPSSTGWIQFCLLIKAHGVNMSLGGPLEIKDKRTWLPLHRNWILLLGITGRFTTRSDEGKMPPKLKGRAKSVQRMPGRYDQRLGTAMFQQRGGQLFYHDPHRYHTTTRDEAGHEIYALYGTFGTLWTMRNVSGDSRDKVYYQHHTAEESGDPSLSTPSIQTLFWLAVGCLPFANGDLYSLENCTLDQSMEETSATVPRTRRASGYTHQVHFENEDDSDEDWTPVPGPVVYKSARHPSSYAAPAEPKRHRHHIGPRDPRVFRFSDVEEKVEELAKVASSLEAPDQPGNVYSLEEVDVPEDDATQLKESLGGTYHPISSTYVRLGRSAGRGEDPEHVPPLFLQRSTAQMLAKALLDLALSPEGHLLGFSKHSWCRTTLCNSAQMLPHLITRICNDLSHLQVPENSRDKFVEVADKLLNMCLNYKPTRAFYHTIHALDAILQQLLPLNPKTMAAIGVVTITSAEFRDFLTGAVRLIPESAGKSVTLDLGPTSTLNIPGVMSVIQKYPVDIAELFPGENISIEAVEIRFHHLLFAALKACLRSTILETSLDSTPLFESFLQMDEVVYMG